MKIKHAFYIINYSITNYSNIFAVFMYGFYEQSSLLYY